MSFTRKDTFVESWTSAANAASGDLIHLLPAVGKKDGVSSVGLVARASLLGAKVVAGVVVQHVPVVSVGRRCWL